MCFSFPLLTAAHGTETTDADLNTDLLPAGTIAEINSPDGAVGIAYDIKTKTTRYYGIFGNTLSANADQPMTAPGWFPQENISTEGETASPDGIIGSDDRTKVTNTKTMPYSAIAYIEMTFPSGVYPATAFMISENVALTAAHCVYTNENGTNAWASSVKVIPGKNGKSFLHNPYGTCQATELVIPVQFYESRNYNYDWALIRLDENIGKKTGYFGYQYIPHSMVGMNVTITGYPAADGYESMRYYQWTHSGEINISDPYADLTEYDYAIDYLIDAQEGQSGSPVYYLNDGTWTVVGIHSKERTIEVNNVPVSTFNRGVRFTSQMFSFVLAYRSKNSP